MLQLSSTLCNSTIRSSCWSLWRLTTMFNSSSTAVHSEATSSTNLSEDNKKHKIQKSIEGDIVTSETDHKKLLNKINRTTNIYELIKFTKNPNLDSESIAKIMSAINIQIKKQNLQDKDEYKILNQEVQATLTNMLMGKSQTQKKVKNVLNKELSEFSVPAMVQVLKNLSLYRQRNVPLLNILCFHIRTCSANLNIRTIGDILYCLATLNYVDEQLIDKMIHHLSSILPHTKRATVISSIVTSIGLLRYKNSKLLEVMAQWSNSHYKRFRYQDIAAFLQSFATFGYKSKSLDSFIENHVYSIQMKDVPDVQEWLDIVWSLTILGKATSSHVSSVLQKTFIEEILGTSNQSISKKLKLLNINGAAQFLVKDYEGPFLEKESKIFDTPLERGKQRHNIVNTLCETLKEITDPSYFKINVNTNMGFCIDAETLMDTQNKLQRINDSENTQNKRIAIMIHDYHDHCRGEQNVLGIVKLYEKLLAAQDYRILTISYLNFSDEDKLQKRVNYLHKQLKNIGVTLT